MIVQTILNIILTATVFSSAITSLVYDTLKSDSIEQITSTLNQLDQEKKSSLCLAYKGTLTMKKADFMKTAKQKIDTFKIGHKILEAEIKAFPNNVEYRFLRFVIQENAPKILKYNKDIEEDKKVVLDNFNQLSPFLQSAIKDYAKESKNLNSSDLN